MRRDLFENEQFEFYKFILKFILEFLFDLFKQLSKFCILLLYRKGS